MPNIDEILEDIETHGSVSFSRAAGPGGQNVNKLNTSVFLTMPVESFTSLSPSDKRLLRERLYGRINSDDELFVRARQQRSQLRNRRYAVMRMAEIVHEGLKKHTPRKKTKPSQAARERRLNDKKRRSELKKSRRLPD